MEWKKLTAAIVASAMITLLVLNGVALEVALACASPLLAYIPSQALADIGKAKALVDKKPV